MAARLRRARQRPSDLAANRFYDPDVPQREYDPDKAKFHLKKAGMEGFSHELSGSDFYAGCMDLILLYKEHAAKAGVEIIPNRMPTDGYWSDVWLKHPWSASFWSGRPTEDWMFTQAYGAESNWNETYWKHERFNMLLREARAELDEAKRRDMYGRCSASAATRAGRSSPSSQAGSARTPTRSRFPTRWRATGRWTATSTSSAGGSPERLLD